MLPASEVLPLPTGPESEAAGSRVGTGTAAATSSSQASVNVPAPSLAEIIARVSSLQQQANSPSTIRWPFLISAGDESLPEGVSQRPDAQGDHTSGYSRSDTPTAASHASAGRGNPAGLNRANPAMPFSSTDTLNPSLAKDDARAELTGASIPASARAAEAAQNAIVPQQRVGLIPLMVGQEAMPAWVQMEWMPVDDREGREGEAKDRQALMVSVHIASETLGHVAFHLAWLPKELAGTIIIEKPDVLHAAQDELPDLETRLAESGLPPPRLRLLRHTAAPWQEETQEIDRT
jgi:hypothetical protein